MSFDPASLSYNAAGLIPAIAQDETSGEILMMAWMNQDAVRQTLDSGRVTYWSRSRQAFWVKGESSGNTQQVKDVAYDCDADTLLIQVEQIGAPCHEGYKSCFFTSVKEGESEITEERLIDPEEMYGKKS